MVKCKICSSKSNYFGSALVLTKYKVKYYQCSNCKFVQTEEPYWLDEAYNSAISAVDVGIVKRNRELAESTHSLIVNFFKKTKSFLDYGAGYGLFVRLMRDKGFNFYWYDKYAENLFSRNFKGNKNKKYDLITAFEVFEHLPNPIEEVEAMLKHGKSIFFSTYLLPKSNPKPNQWWYYVTIAGQHVSIYTRKSLEILAKKHKLNFITDGKNLHLITPLKISEAKFRIIVNKKVSPILNIFRKRKSLINKDFERISGIIKEKLK